MWRSIASRSYISRINVARKLCSLQNPQSQVTHKPLNSSSYHSHSLYLQQQQQQFHFHRFFSQSSSSVSEFETESHDSASSMDLDLENYDTQDDKSFLASGLASDFDGNDEKIVSQISVSSSNDEKSESDVDNLENNDTHDGISSLGSGLGSDYDGNDENIGAQMNVFSSNDEESGVVSNIEKLENVLSLLKSTSDGSLESSLDKLDLNLNEEFVIKVLETPLVAKNHLIRFFKWVLSKNVLEVNTSALSALSRIVCNDLRLRRLDVYALWDLVKERDVVSAEILNLLILAFSKMGKGKAAFEVFEKFGDFGCVPNVDTYYFTIEVLSKRSFYDLAALVSQKMIDDGMLPESDKLGEMISFFCKRYWSKEAYAIYCAAKTQSKYPPQQAVNFLISCLSKVDETVNLAREMLADIPSEVRETAINPFSWVIRGLCRIKDIDGAKKLLDEMIENGPPPGNIVFNMIITSLSKVGELEDAKKMLSLVESRGLKPDVYAYSVIISGYAKVGMMEEACKILSIAQKKHSKLCPATLHALIRGYCKIGEYEKALKLLGEMKDYGVEPNVDEYNKLIQSFCLKALDWNTAEKLLEEMKEKGLYLPGITRGLVNAVKELEQAGVGSEEARVEPL